jgi:hypothetical protein
MTIVAVIVHSTRQLNHPRLEDQAFFKTVSTWSRLYPLLFFYLSFLRQQESGFHRNHDSAAN